MGGVTAVETRMGVFRTDEGFLFRVWAPNARAVFLEGSFNNWRPDSIPMTPESGGNWSVVVKEASLGDEYLFIIHYENMQFLRFDPYARDVISSVGNGVICESTFRSGINFKLKPLKKLVLYELHIGTFNSSAGKVGTLSEAMEKLDYLRTLGVNAVELMPLAEFPMDNSWGYNPAHLFAVESAYGCPQALKRFVAKAHRLGLGVILDVVYNHFGPEDLDLWQFDGWHKNDYGGIYFYNDDRAVTPWGNTRPDYGRIEVRDFIKANALYWINAFEIDGLRFDATAYIRSISGKEESEDQLVDGWTLLQELTNFLKDHRPGLLIMAEDMKENPAITLPVDLGGSGFSAQWAPAFCYPVRDILTVSSDSSRDLHRIVEAITHNYNGNPLQRIIYIESHDSVSNGRARLPAEIQPEQHDGWYARKRAMLGASLLLTSPGIPMLFQGQELLSSGSFDDRVPLDWARLDEYPGFFKAYQDLLALRTDCEGLTGNNISVFHVNDVEKILAYYRWSDEDPGNGAVVVLNFATVTHEHYRIGFPASGTWKPVFNSDLRSYGEDFFDTQQDAVLTVAGEMDGLKFNGEINIGPYGCLIFRFES